MDLIDKVKKAYDESYEIRFNRWFENNDIEKEILQAAKQGYKAYVVYDSKRGKDKFYEVVDFVELLKSKLNGFNIINNEYQETHTNIIFRTENTVTYNKISVGWNNENSR